MKKNTFNVNLMAILASFILLILAAFLYFFWSADAPEKTSDSGQLPSLVEADSPVLLDMGVSSRCIADDSGFFLLLGDGIRRYDNSQKLKWDYPLNLSNPTYVANATYVAVGEYKGTSLNVFGQSGIVYTLNFDNEIINFTVGSNGYAAVTVASTGGGYTINVYNSEGKRITYLVVEVTNNYPIHSTLSPDGRVLAVSFLNLSGTQMESYICAYYLKQSDGLDYTDAMFASFNRTEGEIISKVEFIDDSALMFLSDGQYGVYELSSSNQMVLKWFKEINNEVSFANVISGKGIAIAFGKSIVNKDGLAEGSALILDRSGKQIASYTMEGPVNYLHCGKEAAIIGGGSSGRNFAAVSYKNKVLWEYTATADVLDFVILDKLDKVLLVSSGSITFMETRKSGAPIPKTPAPDNSAAEPAEASAEPAEIVIDEPLGPEIADPVEDNGESEAETEPSESADPESTATPTP